MVADSLYNSLYRKDHVVYTAWFFVKSAKSMVFR